jgi:hypothetical protein
MDQELMAQRGFFRLPSVELFGECTLEPSAWCRLPDDPSLWSPAYLRAVAACEARQRQAEALAALDAVVEELAAEAA